MPKATRCSRAFFTDAVMASLIEDIRSRTRRKTLTVWLIHMDNEHPHNSGRAEKWTKASTAEHLSHPAYSSDLASSDFFLFVYIKGKLSNCNCESREDLLNAITEIFTGVHQEVLLTVFESRANRIKCVVKHKAKYCAK
jgi:hypothetical protein